MWGPCLFLFPLIKLCVSMPVTYLIWDAPLSSPHLAAAHTDSTLLHTSMTLAPPEEDDEGEKDEEIEGWRSTGWTGIWHFFFVFIYIVASSTCWLRVQFSKWSHFRHRLGGDYFGLSAFLPPAPNWINKLFSEGNEVPRTLLEAR